MKIINKKEAYKGKYVKVIEKKVLTKSGKEEIWECVKRKDAVFIFALTKKREVILEKIFRIPINDYVISLPAGMLDKKTTTHPPPSRQRRAPETPKETAKRELLEETGYLAKKLIKIFKWPLNPGVSIEKATLFFAPNVKFTGKPKAKDDVEEIEVIKIPLKDLEDFLIKQSKKKMVDLKILGVVPLLKKRKLI